MAFAMLPGTENQYQQLRAQVAKHSFVAIVAGPPGTGKKTAVRHIAAEASLRAHDVEVEHAWSPEELRARIAKLGTQLTDDPSMSGAETLWLVHNAEILERCAAVWREVECRGHRVILVMHDVPRAYRDQFSPVYFNRLTDVRMKEWVRREYPRASAERVAQAANGDLNQARIAATFRTGGKDRSGHVWFDTLAVVNGGCTEPEKVSTDWVHENMLERCTDIQAAAALSETFALADAMRALEGAGCAPTAPGLEAEIVQRAVHRVRASGKARWAQGVRAPKRVDCPGGFAMREWRRHRGISSSPLQANTCIKRKWSNGNVEQANEKVRKTTSHARVASGTSSSSPAAEEPSGNKSTGLSVDGCDPNVGAPAQAPCAAPPGRLAPCDRVVYDGKPEFEVRALCISRSSDLQIFRSSDLQIFRYCIVLYCRRGHTPNRRATRLGPWPRVWELRQKPCRDLR